MVAEPNMSGARVLIVAGDHRGREGVCLGPSEKPAYWFVSPDDSAAILELMFPDEFGLLVDLSGDPQMN
jgi:hypothetical protein